MSTYIPFTQARKDAIVHMKLFVTDPANKPKIDAVYGNRYQRLFLNDYAVYAVLRGADFKKTSHMPDAANAVEALQSALKLLDQAIKDAEKSESKAIRAGSWVMRWLAAGADIEAATELRDLIAAALAVAKKTPA